MNGLEFKIDPAQFPNKPLNDPSVGVDLIGAKASYSGDQKLGGLSFGFGVSGSAEVAVINSEDDPDKDGILGKPTEDSTFDLVLQPPLRFDPEKAWLKYRYSAAIKGSVSGLAAPVEFKLEGSKEAIFTDFHVHPANDNTQKALIQDLPRLRFAANVDDIFQLQPQEALSFQVRGRIFSSITVSWSDVIASNISALSQILQAGQLLALKVSAAASLTFRVELLDDFRVIFTKGSGNRIGIALKKADSRAIGVAAALGVTVSFANPTELQTALESVINSVAGEPVNKIDQILNKATFQDLSATEKKIVEELIKRLGLSEPVDALNKVKEKWDELKERVQEKIESLAKAKVELGFTYDYLRLRAEESLFEAEVERNTLSRFHNDLMLCNLTRLLEHLLSNPASGELKKYLNQKTDRRQSAWGFSLGIGKHNIASGEDKKEFTQIIQTNERKEERIAYQGLRQYSSRWLDDDAKFKVDFKAQLEEFKPPGSATMDQFKYGLYISWEWNEKKLKESELRTFLDHAILWRIIDPDQVSEIVALMKPAFGKRAQVRQELRLEDETLRVLLPFIARSIATDLPVIALAKAMPMIDMYEGRRSPAMRELLYAGLWKSYFEKPSRPINLWPGDAAMEVERIVDLKQIANGSALARLELKGRGSSSEAPHEDGRTFAGQLYKHGKTPDDYSGVFRKWQSFASALRQLNDAVKPGSGHAHKEIGNIFKNLSKFCDQSLFLRAAGTLITDTAASDRELLRQLSRSFTITMTNGDAVTFARSA